MRLFIISQGVTMGKKKRAKRLPQKFGRKFGRKFASFIRVQANLRELKEEAVADGIVTLEEQAKITEAEAAVESLTPVLDAVEEILAPEPVADETVPEPAAETPVIKEKPKKRRTRKTTKKSVTKKRTTGKKAKDKESHSLPIASV
jgi:hypothetical protein